MVREWSAAIAGHYWTLKPFLVERRPGAGRALAALRSEPWSLEVADPRLGSVRLTGRRFTPPGADRLLLAVHGLGGNAESSYLRAAVLDAYAAGIACLCLNLRGADGLGEDFYHAALSSDLHAVLLSPELAHFRSIYGLGFSLGGHLVLRYATETHDPRLLSVAAICAPLDLQRSQLALDATPRVVYRQYVLRKLKASYVANARRREVPSPVEQVLRAHSIRRWDELTVVPRFGFRSAAEYYREASVAPRLAALDVPALLVLAERDPMVPADTLRPALDPAPSLLDVRWFTRGGHVGFPDDFDLGEPAPVGLPSQIRSWLLRASQSSGRAARQTGALSIL